VSIWALLEALPLVIAAASAISAVTPTAKDDAAVRWVRRLVEVLALNVGNARPAAPRPPEPGKRKNSGEAGE